MKKFYSLLLFTLFGILSSYAQTIDETFKEPTAYKAAKISVIKELADGKILLAGKIAFYQDKKVNNLIRLNSDYSLDESFVFVGDPGFEIKDVKFQSNGNIIVLTTKDNFGLADYFKLYQLNPNGDIVKEITTIFNATAIAIQADNKILVTGGAPGYYDFTSCYLNRFNSDFSLDETFNNDLAFNTSTTSLVVSKEGSIYVGGTFTTINEIAKNSIVKLTSDGEIDETFDVGQGSNGSAFSMTLQEDGKLLVGGSFLPKPNEPLSSNIRRLNLDGSFDDTFNSYYLNFHASTVIVKDSYVYFGMYDAAAFKSYIAKLNPDGSLNQTFSLGRLNERGEQFFTMGLIDDKIIYNNSGNVGNKYGLSVCDLNGNQLDSSELKPSQYGTFDKGVSFDGKLVVKGDFVKINDVDTNDIALLNEDGSVDPSFAFSNYLGEIKQFQVVDNETIFVSSNEKLLKLNNKGEILKDFNFEDVHLISVDNFKVLESGTILVSDIYGLYFVLGEGEGGIKSFTLPTNTQYWFVGTKFDLQEGKIIFGAMYNDYRTVPNIYSSYEILRIDITGQVDDTFKINGSGPDTSISKIKVLDTGEIILAGDFLNFNGLPVPNQIVKLSKDGEMDLEFNENQKSGTIGISTNHDYRKIEQVGNVLYITEGDANVTAINLDGTFVKDFELPVEMDQVSDIVAVEEQITPAGKKSTAKAAIDADRFIFAIGSSKNTGAEAPSFIVKLNVGKDSGSLGVGPIPQKEISNVLVYPIPVTEKMSLSFSNSIAPTKIVIYSVNGAEVYTADLKNTDSPEIDMSQLNSGIYFVKVFSEKGTETKKIIKK